LAKQDARVKQLHLHVCMNSAKVIKLPWHSVQILLNAENERGMDVPAFGDGEDGCNTDGDSRLLLSFFFLLCPLSAFSFYFSQQLLELRR
jgi:hypothetical protein